jgi:hypothetical protein
MVYAASKHEMKKLDGVQDDCQANDLSDLNSAVEDYIKTQKAKGR